MVSQQRIVSPGAGKQHQFRPGELFIWKTLGTADGGALDFGELTIEPGVGVPQHIHHGNDEAYYILDGTFKFKVGDEVAEASEGSFISIPRGTPHAWTNIGTRTGRAIILFTPGGMSGFFEDIEPFIPALTAGMADMSKVDPAVLAKVETISRNYQYEIVGPPLS